MNRHDPLIEGEMLGDQFHYHVLDVAGPPMIHVTRNRLPEIVLFGAEQRLSPPLAISAGNEIMITCRKGSEISVSKFTVADGDQKRIVSCRLDDVIRAVIELGGTYPDVVQALQEAKNCGALSSRFEVDALPEAGRTYDRLVDAREPAEKNGAATEETLAEGKTTVQVSPESPSPGLFHKSRETNLHREKPGDESVDESQAAEDDETEEPAAKKGIFRAAVWTVAAVIDTDIVNDP